MILTILPQDTAAATGFTHKVTITYADFASDAALTATKQLVPGSGTWLAGKSVKCVGTNVITPFEGASVTSLTIEIGDGDDADRLHPAQEILKDAGAYSGFGLSNLGHSYDAADSVDALFTAIGANLSVLTAGEVQIYLAVVDLNSLEKD